MNHRFAALCLTIALTTEGAWAGSLRHPQLQRDLERLSRGFDGRVGACAVDSAGASCIHGDRRFPLQSVMKLLVALAVMDRVDRRGWRLDDEILARPQDLSLFVQPLAALVSKQGYKTTVGDLVRRAIVASDSAAADILIDRLGGPPQVQAFLERNGANGVRLDRDERHLQTEILGLIWRPEYVDPAVLDKAIAAVPAGERTAAYHRYQADPRDTATPDGMAGLLQKLATGGLFSPASTRYVLEVMAQTVTFPDRLKAGVPRGWTLAHKTGTSGSWQGITAATNDVGVLRAPDGGSVSLVVFIRDSHASPAARAALMAKIAAATTARYVCKAAATEPRT